MPGVDTSPAEYNNPSRGQNKRPGGTFLPTYPSVLYKAAAAGTTVTNMKPTGTYYAKTVDAVNLTAKNSYKGGFNPAYPSIWKNINPATWVNPTKVSFDPWEEAILDAAVGRAFTPPLPPPPPASTATVYDTGIDTTLEAGVAGGGSGGSSYEGGSTHQLNITNNYRVYAYKSASSTFFYIFSRAISTGELIKGTPGTSDITSLTFNDGTNSYRISSASSSTVTISALNAALIPANEINASSTGDQLLAFNTITADNAAGSPPAAPSISGGTWTQTAGARATAITFTLVGDATGYTGSVSGPTGTTATFTFDTLIASTASRTVNIPISATGVLPTSTTTTINAATAYTVTLTPASGAPLNLALPVYTRPDITGLTAKFVRTTTAAPAINLVTIAYTYAGGDGIGLTPSVTPGTGATGTFTGILITANPASSAYTNFTPAASQYSLLSGKTYTVGIGGVSSTAITYNPRFYLTNLYLFAYNNITATSSGAAYLPAGVTAPAVTTPLGSLFTAFTPTGFSGTYSAATSAVCYQLIYDNYDLTTVSSISQTITSTTAVAQAKRLFTIVTISGIRTVLYLNYDSTNGFIVYNNVPAAGATAYTEVSSPGSPFIKVALCKLTTAPTIVIIAYNCKLSTIPTKPPLLGAEAANGAIQKFALTADAATGTFINTGTFNFTLSTMPAVATNSLSQEFTSSSSAANVITKVRALGASAPDVLFGGKEIMRKTKSNITKSKKYDNKKTRKSKKYSIPV